ncbi:MAG: leucine-rich repeat protein [Oscillospiraceae bacterium]|nr:leucine-rich repeat protein [Oscillospiraceae bacterium]
MLKFDLKKIISGVACMVVAVSSMFMSGSLVADAVNLENIAPVNKTYFWGSSKLENGLEYKVYEDYVSIIGCDASAEGEMVIPEMIEGLPVKNIGEETFKNCSSLTSITIPDSISGIRDNAFYGCSSLTAINVDSGNRSYMDIEGVLFSKDQKKLLKYPAKKSDPSYSIPDSVTNIGESAFRDCSFLTSVIIPDGVTRIGNSAFWECSSLESITISDSVAGIGSQAFYNCSALTSVTVPDGIIRIEDYTFHGCSSLESVTIPDSVTNIGQFAFDECSSLKSITIPNGVINIGQFAFGKCSALESITIPDSVTNIAGWAFSYCPALTSVTISNNITTIGYYVFAGCLALKSITIPNSVTYVDMGAFYNCSSLTSIIIPNSVTKLESIAFGNCSSLTSITIQNADCKINNNAGYTISNTVAIYGYPDSTAQAYAEENGNPFEVISSESELKQDTTDSEINPEILWGDANHDGNVDISDVVLMNRVYVGVDQISAEGMKNADVDQSGKIELADSMNVLRLLVHLLDQSDFPIQA